MNIEDILKLQQQIALYEDMTAYKQLYFHFFDRLFKFSCSYVKSPEAAEEIVSDVFIKIWEIRSTLGSINNLTVYLFTITKNFSLNYITRHHKTQMLSIDEWDDSDMAIDFVTPLDTIISSEIVIKINSLISQLPPQCRMIMYLVKDCNLKYKEVAVILNLSVNTVRNQLSIAVKKIADGLPSSLKAQLTSIARFSES